MKQSKEHLDQLDLAHFWHPFTQMSEYADYDQLHVDHGLGCWVWDTEGNKYLDANASIWTNVHGHNDPDLNKVLIDQINKISHSTTLGISHEPGIRLAKKLADISPGSLNRVFYSDNGSNAVEIALKLSFQYWQLVGETKRTKVISMENAYHGDTFGTMGIGDSGVFHERFSNWCFPAIHFQSPKCVEVNEHVSSSSDIESLESLEKIFIKHADEIACLIIEPSVQGAAGMKFQPKGFLKKIELMCAEKRVHLIVDEVFTGFGRVGEMLVVHKEEVEPDFLCLAKGLTAGYLPLAATVAKDEIFDQFLGRFSEFKTFFHGHTFTGNPLGSVVALKSIEKLELLFNEGHLSETIAYLGNRLSEVFEDHPNVREIRQRGFCASIDLCPEGVADQEFPIEDRVGLKIAINARKHGLLLRPLANSILIVPPIVISKSEIDFLVENLKIALNSTL